MNNAEKISEANKKIFELSNRISELNNMTVVVMSCFQILVDKNIISTQEFASAFEKSSTEIQPIYDKTVIEGSAIRPEEAGPDEASDGNSDT